MSYIRRLPSGRRQATVCGPDGRKHTKSRRLRVVVSDWAKDQEGKPRAQRTNPRAGHTKVSDWRARYAVAHASKASAPRNVSLCAVHRIRVYPPRVMRHTAASWLVQDGVPLYDVETLLGHESFATTQRYAHLAPDAHSKILQSWKRRAATGGGTR